MAGVSYLHFVTPGLLVASVMQQAAGESMWPVLGGVKWDRRYLAMVATPLAPDDVQRSVLLLVAIRNALTASAFLLVATLMGGIGSPWAVLAVPAAVLCGAAFTALLSGLAIRQENDTTLSLVYRLGIMPVFLFSGSFFPISVLPAWLRPVAWASPLWHGVELARHASTADVHWGADAVHLVVLAGIVFAASAWARAGFRRPLTPGSRHGGSGSSSSATCSPIDASGTCSRRGSPSRSCTCCRSASASATLWATSAACHTATSSHRG